MRKNSQTMLGVARSTDLSIRCELTFKNVRVKEFIIRLFHKGSQVGRCHADLHLVYAQGDGDQEGPFLEFRKLMRYECAKTACELDGAQKFYDFEFYNLLFINDFEIYEEFRGQGWTKLFYALIFEHFSCLNPDLSAKGYLVYASDTCNYEGGSLDPFVFSALKSLAQDGANVFSDSKGVFKPHFESSFVARLSPSLCRRENPYPHFVDCDEAFQALLDTIEPNLELQRAYVLENLKDLYAEVNHPLSEYSEFYEEEDIQEMIDGVSDCRTLLEMGDFVRKNVPEEFRPLYFMVHDISVVENIEFAHSLPAHRAEAIAKSTIYGRATPSKLTLTRTVDDFYIGGNGYMFAYELQQYKLNPTVVRFSSHLTGLATKALKFYFEPDGEYQLIVPIKCAENIELSPDIEESEDDYLHFLQHDHPLPIDLRVSVLTAVPRQNLALILRKGLASQKAISEDPELTEAFLSQRGISEDEWREELDEALNSWKPESRLGPSVFFTPPDPSKVSDPRHFIHQFDTVTLRVNLGALLRDIPKTKVLGVELQPFDEEGYKADPTNPKFNRLSRIKYLTLEEIAEYVRTPPKELWKHYKEEYLGKYYAADVPHAFVMTPSGIIPPQYLEVIEDKL